MAKKTAKKRTTKKRGPTKKELEALWMKLIDMDGDQMCRRCEGLIDAHGFNCGRGRWLTTEGKQADIMILISAPSKLDAMAGKFASNLVEKTLEGLLQESKLAKKKVYVDAGVRCSLAGRSFEFQDAATKKKLQANCKPYLLREIERLKPKVIVPVGNHALKMLTGLDGIHGWNGRVIQLPKFRCRVVPVYDLEQVNRSFHIRERAIKAFETVAQVLSVGAPVKETEKKARLVRTKRDVQSVLAILKSNKYAFDIETKGRDPKEPETRLVGFSVANKANVGWFMPVMEVTRRTIIDDEVDEEVFVEYERHPLFTKQVESSLRQSLQSPAKRKYIHNVEFEWKWMAEKNGIRIAGAWDTMLANNVLDPFLGSNGLKDLTHIYTDAGGYEDSLEEFFKGVAKSKRDYSRVPPETLGYYAAMDALVTFQLGEAQSKIASKDERKKILHEFFKLRQNLSEMSFRGCPVDLAESKKLSKKFDGQQKRAHTDLRKLSGDKEFNPNSNPQIIQFFYGSEDTGPGLFKTTLVRQVLGAKAMRKGPSMDKFAMQAWADFFEQQKREHTLRSNMVVADKAIKALQKYRIASKLKSTYTDVFQFKSHNARISPTFNTGATATARLSCSQPNMQNIPRQHDIRNCIASDGGVIAELDYSQLEIRIAAEYCRDKKWIELLNSGADTHAFIGANTIGKLGRKHLGEEYFKDGELRAKAKIIGFSVIYGKTPAGLAQDLGVLVDEAAQIIQLIFDTFPKLGDWVAEQKKYVRQYGYVTTLFHRRLPVVEALSSDEAEIARAHRLAVNYPVQSAASDRVVIALNAVHDWLRKERLIESVRPVLTVHDSILFEIQNKRRNHKKLIQDLKKIMEARVPEIKHVQLKVDAKIGENWGVAKKM